MPFLPHPLKCRAVMPERPGSRRGVALLIVLGVLVVLSLLGTVFATMTGIERSVARNYIDKVRARLLAQSGVEHAFAALGREHGKAIDIWSADRPAAWVYGGGDLNANGAVDAGDVNRDADPAFPDVHTVAVDEALRPSFPLDRNRDGAYDGSDLVSIDGRAVGVSGMTAGTYGAEGNVYSLRVHDLQGRININNRHAHLRTVLNRLAARLGLAATLGDAIEAARAAQPDGQFIAFEQLVPALGRDAVERLRPHLTVHSWTDPKALKGIPLARRIRPLAVGDSVYTYWELRPKSLATSATPASSGSVVVTGGAGAGAGATGDLEARSPININTASREVLASILEGLQGCFIKEQPLTTEKFGSSYPPGSFYPPGILGSYRWGRTTLTFSGKEPILAPYNIYPSDAPAGTREFPCLGSGQVGILYQTPAVGPRTADAVAAEILKARAAWTGGTSTAAAPVRTVFRSYQQLAAFIDQLPDSVFDPAEIGVPPAADATLDLAYVRQAVRDVLKANLDPNAHLNELNPDEALALKVDKTDLSYWTFEACFIPLGSFEIESLGRVVDAQGREVASEKIAVEARLFDLHRDTTQADFQRDFSESGAPLSEVFSASGAPYWQDGHLAAYPELYYEADHVRQSTYDGYLGLLPLANLPGGGGATLRARFATSLDPEGGTVLADPGASGPVNLADGPWKRRMLGEPEPGSLMPDGVFSEKDTAPGFANLAYFNQHRGTVLLWVKPAFEPEHAGKPRPFFSLQTYDLCKARYTSWLSNVFSIMYYPLHSAPPLDAGGDTAATRATYAFRYLADSAAFPRSILAGCGGANNRELPPPAKPNYPAINTAWKNQPSYMEEPMAFTGSPTLNHVGHAHGPDDYTRLGQKWGNLMLKGRWILIGYAWRDWNSARTRDYDMSINNKAVPWEGAAGNAGGQAVGSTWYQTGNTLWGPPGSYDANGDQYGPPAGWSIASGEPTAASDGTPFDRTKWQFGLPAENGYAAKHKGGKMGPEDVPIRLGAVANAPMLSEWAAGRRPEYAGHRYPFNFPADSTIDEVMLWPGDETVLDAKIGEVWREGRFYKSFGAPDKAAAGTLARFTSAKFPLPSAGARLLPPAGNAPPPGALAPAAGSTAPLASGAVRLGIIAYTLRYPDYAGLGVDYPSGKAPAPRVYADILGASKSSLLSGAAVLGYTDPSTRFALGGGAIAHDATAAGNPVDVAAASEIRYRLWIDSGLGDRLNDPYTATPVIDDVLITYALPNPELLSWSVRE